jgi:hypothetical protein
MKRYFLAVFLFTGTPLLCAAQKNHYLLKGFMGVQGGESFTYKLDLKDSTGNILSGYAYTYSKETNDVQAYVIAVVDRGNKTLSIKEKDIIRNNYFESRATICLVEAVLTYSAKENTISGPLITRTSGNNGANCSSGSISFNTATELSQLFNPQITRQEELPVAASPKKSPAPARKPEQQEVNPFIGNSVKPAQQALPEIKKPDNITEGKDKMYTWQSDDIVLEIWDGNTVDNDKVNVLYNGQEVLTNYTLTKEKKKLTFPVGGNELNIISVIAVNEGSEPPNTANILLTDGTTSYEVIAHNTVGKRASIKIRKK